MWFWWVEYNADLLRPHTKEGRGGCVGWLFLEFIHQHTQQHVCLSIYNDMS